MTAIFIFIIGLFIGSFLNVCIYRIPREESIVFPSSHCTKCNTRLKPYDLIPVFSYLAYGGKCKSCRERISLQYPIIESLNGLIYLLLYLQFDLTIHFVFFAILSSLLTTISGIDYHHQIIPDGLVLIGVVIGVFYIGYLKLMTPQTITLIDHIVGGLVGGGVLLLLAIASKGGMGGGDIKLMAMFGLWLGWRLSLLTLFLSFVMGGIVGVLFLLLKLKGKKDAIPFGPFICLGGMASLLYGERILTWYLQMFYR